MCFLQRGREAQRCQVTPYVVNFAAAAAAAAAAEGAIAKYKFFSLLKPS